MDRQAATDCGGWRAAYWLWQIVYDPCDHVREVLPHIPTAARRSRSAPRRPLWACFIGYRPIHTASATAMTTAAMKIAVSTGAIVHIGSSDALFLRPRSLQLCALISVLIWIKPSSRYSPVPPSAPSVLKGNSFISRAMSSAEIAKLAGSAGAEIGGYLSFRRSQARSSSRSPRNAARRNCSKKRCRCPASSRPQPSNVASARSVRRISREP
jgi:hypothetical protein